MHDCFSNNASRVQMKGGLPHVLCTDAITQGGKFSTRKSLRPDVEAIKKNIQSVERTLEDKGEEAQLTFQKMLRDLEIEKAKSDE